ncbi:butyrophilin subfamily 2 member A2-like [Discoglossus pictus]
MGFPMFLILSIFLAFEASQAKLEVITDPAPVVAKVGENVHLKCIMKVCKEPLDLKKMMVQWYNRGQQVVEYDNKLTINKPEYSLSLDALKKGDASLTITKVTAEHNGKYRCYLDYGSESSIKEVILQVDDPNKPKEEEVDLIPAEDTLTKKVDLVVQFFTSFNVKLDELMREMKKCVPKP